jgi:hypothetical protein
MLLLPEWEACAVVLDQEVRVVAVQVAEAVRVAAVPLLVGPHLRVSLAHRRPSDIT